MTGNETMEKAPRKLPPLNALRAFEAAGRHTSFTTAAEELHVTVSAVSHHIRRLEALLGVPLFDRTPRGLVLSAAGRLLLPDVQKGFDQLAKAVSRVETTTTSRTLTVSMLSTFAMRWFIPRLSRFQGRFPEINVQMATSVKPINLEREGMDCAIRYGRGVWEGLEAIRLFSERLVPVCHPKMLDGNFCLRNPDDLRHHCLLHAALRPDDWRIWLHAAGVTDVDCTAGTVFETRNFAILAAIEGLGVAVVDPQLVREELTSRRLVQPFATSITLDGAYFLVYPAQKPVTPKIQHFRAWLLEETGQAPRSDGVHHA